MNLNLLNLSIVHDKWCGLSSGCNFALVVQITVAVTLNWLFIARTQVVVHRVVVSCGGCGCT